MNLISVEEAEKIIEKTLPVYGMEIVPLPSAYGRVLREDIKADRDGPPFAKSLVDGIAISLAAYESGVRRFPIQGIQPAGIKGTRLTVQDSALEIMTGAVVPSGADCIIPVEQIQKEGKMVLLKDLELKGGQFIRPQAADHKKGEVLLKEGRCLGSSEIAIAASVGKATVKVSKRPKVAVISTGDELVDIGHKAAPYQVRTSNSYAVACALSQNGFPESEIFHIPDDRKDLLKKLKKILKQFDVLILSGGVSMGQFDFVPSVLTELKVERKFHKIRQRPGKPFWFGTKKDKLVFALPGNPLSTIICTYRYVIPALKKAGGLARIPTSLAILNKEIKSHAELTFLLPVKVWEEQGQRKAETVRFGGSGDFGVLGQSDGFVELSSREGAYKKNELVPFYSWA